MSAKSPGMKKQFPEVTEAALSAHFTPSSLLVDFANVEWQETYQRQ